MGPKSAKAWDIYASQLEPLGYGYPLWVPGGELGAPPVELGDVGYIHEGQFIPLFNALKNGDDTTQPRGRVPAGYRPLGEVMTLGPQDKILQPVLFSHSMKKSNGSAGANASISPVDVSGKFELKFDCTDDAGALLCLEPSARTHEILSKGLIVSYILAGFDAWLNFANRDLGLSLREDQLIFVSGTTKTSRWAVASFAGKTRSKSGSISGNVGSAASLNISLSFSDTQDLPCYYSKGPRNRDTDDVVFDQCIFIHYYKRKQRPFVMSFFMAPRIKCLSIDRSAYASDNEGEASTVEVEVDSKQFSHPLNHGEIVDDTEEPNDKGKDFAEHALDYILAESDASVGIASDADFFCSPAHSSDGSVDAPDCSVGTRLPHVIMQSYTAAMIRTDVISADYITYAFETMHRQAGDKPSASSLPLEADKEREQVLNGLLRELIGDHFVGAVRELLPSVIIPQGLRALFPEENPMILDLGTGTGQWMMDMALELPHVQFYGLDTTLSPAHPIPSNITYALSDVTKPLRAFRDGSVNMVHVRSLAAAVNNYPDILREVARTLRRGGLFVSGEWGDFLAMADGSDVCLRAPRACVFFTALRETLRLRRDIESAVSRIPDHLRELGQFEGVEAQRFHAPIGDWPNDPATKKLGQGFAQMMIQYARSTREELSRGPLGNYADTIVDGLVWDVENVPGLVSVYYTVHARRV